MISAPIRFILLLSEDIAKIPRNVAVARTKSPRRFEKIMLKMIRIAIVAIVI